MNRSVALSQIKRFALAVAAVAAATALRAALTPLVGPRLPFIFYFPAVTAAAWLGLGPGVMAVVLSYLAADWFFIVPIVFTSPTTIQYLPEREIGLLRFDSQSLTEFLSFAISGGLIVGLTHGFRHAQERSMAYAREAARRGEFLKVTMQSIGDGVITTDAEGRITLMNSVAEQLTGWTQAEAVGRPLTEALHVVNEQTRQRVENPCDKVLRTGKIVGLANHTVLISKDGSERPIDDSAAPIVTDKQEIVGVVVVFRDATDERAAFSAVQTLAAIVEHSDDAMISRDLGEKIISWNAAAERLYGYTAAEAVGQPINIIVPPDRRQELKLAMERMLRGERMDHWDTVRRHKDGTLVNVSLRSSPLKNAYGEVVGASIVARDVTQRKRAEAALAFLAETSATLSALVDLESALQQAAQTMVPYFADWCVIYLPDGEGEIGQPVFAHRDPQKRDQLTKFLNAYLSDSTSPSITLQAWRSGVTQFVPEMPDSVRRRIASNDELLTMFDELDPRSVIGVPMQIRERRIGVISFVRSEPGRRYVEADLALAEDLARRVAIAIDNAQLLHSAREIDRQKDEFLAMLAHELRNPLAAISYAVEAARLPDPQATGEMLDLIDRQIVNLARLIDDLLDISRISRDKIQLRRETIDASLIVRRASATIRPQVEEKRHKLVVEISPEPMPISVDPTRAEQIVANLLTNAAKYTPEGGRITVRAFPENGEAVIKVADTGIGILPEMLPYVFELFAQADRTLDRSQGGLGIGLTVVRKLAEMHGGTVAVNSRGVGYGSEFTVRLPLSAAQPSELDLAAPSVNGDAPKLRVLVVEDNRDTARVEELFLRKYGHDVAVAHDGQSALDAAQEFRPHAVLLDIGLPVLNGYEVASRLRELGFANELLIAVSGYGQMDDRERSRRAGFDHHLVKPVDHQALLTILHSIRPQDVI